MKNDANVISSPRNRRSFLKTRLAAAGAVGTGLRLWNKATAVRAALAQRALVGGKIFGGSYTAR